MRLDSAWTRSPSNLRRVSSILMPCSETPGASVAETSEKRLVVLMAGKRVGVVGQGEDGRLWLEYEEPWRIAKSATPLSLSMPLARRAHQDALVRPFLWGLLPDNERVLERWARDYQVSAGNPFALLRHVGE